MQKITPFLWFDGKAEEAAELYASVFKNSRIVSVNRFSESGPGRPGTVMEVEFDIAGQRFAALNGGPEFSFTPAVSFFVSCGTAGEVERLFHALSENGKVMMALDKYPFSEKYGWCVDRYGLSWQLFCGTRAQKVSPCLMFVGKQYGRSMEAMKFYSSVFTGSKIGLAVPYEKGEGEKEGSIKHAEFSLSGTQFMAMDSGNAHAFTFTPAVSFMVECRDQAEIDHFWNRLSAVPEMEQCGWLQDAYGVSWQIVPAQLKSLLSGHDPEKSDRVMKALLQMKKIDLEALRRA